MAGGRVAFCFHARVFDTKSRSKPNMVILTRDSISFHIELEDREYSLNPNCFDDDS